MLRVFLLGHPRAEFYDKPFELGLSSSALNLFAYLLLNSDTLLERKSVAFTMWPDETEAEAQTKLRRLLYRLTRSLPPAVNKPWILTERNSIRWNPESPFWLDVHEFETTCRDAAMRQRAVDLYEGDLVQTSDAEWIALYREKLRNQYTATLFDLVLELRSQRRLNDALKYARDLRAIEPLREDVVRQIMAVRHEAGDRAGALADYETFESQLREEMSAAPMSETRALYDAIVGRRAIDAPVQSEVVPKAESRIDDVPFVGREKEMKQLQSAFGRMIQGRGATVFITGEAGIGKTRLAREFSLLAQAGGALVLSGGTSLPEATPYQAIAEAFSSAVALLADLTIEPVWLGVLATIVPSIRAQRPDLPEVQPIDEARELVRLQQGLLAILAAMSAARPLVLILEDIHWAGAACIEAIAFLAQHCANHRLLTVLSYRDDETLHFHAVAEMHRKLRKRDDVFIVSPGRFSKSDISTLLSANGSEDATLAGRILKASEGNALFVTQILDQLQEPSGTNSRAQVFTSTSLQDTISRRIDALSDNARSLGEIASVLGTQIDVTALREMTGWEEGRIAEMTGELLDHHFIREAFAAERADFVFRHQLLQSGLYGAMSPQMRRRRHFRAATILERTGGIAEHPSQLALHYEISGHLEKAAAAYCAAAERAHSLHANLEAMDFVSKGLEFTRDDNLRVRLLLLRETLSRLRGDRELQRLDLDQLMDLARVLDDKRLVAETTRRRAVLARTLGEREAEKAHVVTLSDVATELDASWKAHAALEASAFHMVGSDFARAEGLLDEATALYGLAGNKEGELDCLSRFSEIAFQQLDWDKARAIVARGKRMLEETNSLAARAKLLEILVYASNTIEAFEDARSYAKTLLEVAAEIGDRKSEAFAHHRLAGCSVFLYDTDAVQKHATIAHAIYRDLGDMLGEASILHVEGLGLQFVGRFAEALPLFQRAIALYESLGAPQAKSKSLLSLNRVYLGLDKPREALEAAQESIALSQAVNERLVGGALLGAASAAAMLADFAAAIDYGTQAVLLSRRSSNEESLAEMLPRLAESLLCSGDLAGAWEAIAESLPYIAGIADPMSITPEALFYAAVVHRAKGEATSKDLLQRAYDLFHTRFALIRDEKSRRSYSAIRVNSEIIAAFERDAWPERLLSLLPATIV